MIAITNHAVERFRERVDGAKNLSKESIRNMIDRIYGLGLAHGAVFKHPSFTNRRMVPFMSGKSTLYLSIGLNDTKFNADLAIIGVLFESEYTEGKATLGVKLEELM